MIVRSVLWEAARPSLRDRRLVLLRFGRMPLGLFENGELVPLQGREVFIVLQLGLAVEDGYLPVAPGNAVDEIA